MFNILVVFGSILGKILSNISKEEVVEGNKYFLFSEKILLVVLALGFLLIDFSIFSLGIFLGVLIYYFFKRLSLFLGLGVFLTDNFVIASFVLIYLVISSRNLSWKDVGLDSLLFLIPFGFILVESFIKGNSSFLLSVISGILIGPVAQLGRNHLRN